MSANTIPDRAALIEPTEEVIKFVSRYGGMCRDCEDFDSVCPHSGLPCVDRSKAIKHVIEALNYGHKHGYILAILNPPSAASSRAEQTGAEVVPPASAPVANSNWITWNGGECPVEPEALVQYRMADGDTSTWPERAGPLIWSWTGHPADIIAYRVVPNLTHEEAQ